MANVLIVAEQSGGALRAATLNALGAGRALAERTGGVLHVALLGSGVAALAPALARHAEGVHVADAPVLAEPLAEAYAPVIAAIARAAGATHVGAAATSFGKDVLPRAAALLEAGMASEVLRFGGEGPAVTFVRPAWAGNVLAEVEITTAVKVFTVRPTEFPASVAAEEGAVLGAPVEVDPAALGTRRIAFEQVKSARPELTEARVVVAGGRGTRGDFAPVEALADALGGAVAASRAAVDAGWAPNDWQVGQTGKVVAPELYVAAGISGAIQHLAGMKGSKVIVAVNKDPEAPVFQVADYGLVGDLARALPELTARLASAR